MTCRKKHTIENDLCHLFPSSWLSERAREICPTQSDVTLCPGCGGRLRLVAVLSDSASIRQLSERGRLSGRTSDDRSG